MKLSFFVTVIPTIIIKITLVGQGDAAPVVARKLVVLTFPNAWKKILIFTNSTVKPEMFSVVWILSFFCGLNFELFCGLNFELFCGLNFELFSGPNFEHLSGLNFELLSGLNFELFYGMNLEHFCGLNFEHFCGLNF